MADIFLICVIVISLVILLVVGLYLLVKYQHPDDKNDAYIPKLIVWFGFVLAGATVLLLPLDVANNEGYAGEFYTSAYIGFISSSLLTNIIPSYHKQYFNHIPKDARGSIPNSVAVSI